MWITLTLLACVGRPSAPAPSQEPAPAEAPRLVVLLVADQLPVELFGRVQPHFKHGLATLTDEAAWVGRAIFTHSVTLTCPGHATLASGASPRVHGIVSNNWVTQGEAKYCGDIANLRADTIGDRVHEAGGKVASLSIKDRAAIMMGGRNPNAAVWYLRNEGTWNEQAPEWALQSQIDAVLNSTWEPLDPSLYAQHFPDRQEHEEDHEPMGGTTFPHGPPGTDNPAYFRMMPGSGEVLTDLGLTAVDNLQLGADEIPDLLAISYSQTDYVGHAFTPQSWEAMDTLLRLDRDLARLFEGLDERVGPGRYTVLMTSDHGAANANATRLSRDALVSRADEALKAAGIEAATQFAVPYLLISGEGLTEEMRAEAAKVVAEAVQSVEGVHAAVPWREGGVPDSVPQADAVRQSLYPERAGDVFVLVGEDTVVGYGELARGTGHGGPWYHDSHVPLMMRGPGVTAARDLRVDARQVAPTIAALMGIAPPQQAELGPVVTP